MIQMPIFHGPEVSPLVTKHQGTEEACSCEAEKEETPISVTTKQGSHSEEVKNKSREVTPSHNIIIHQEYLFTTKNSFHACLLWQIAKLSLKLVKNESDHKKTKRHLMLIIRGWH